MKYLRKFDTKNDVFVPVKPNVVLVADTGEISYNVDIPNGVYIEHIDGSLYTADMWTAEGFASDKANGVAVIDSRCRFVIAKTNVGQYKWASNTSSLLDGVTTPSLGADAPYDYAGAENTASMLLTDTSEAAYSCANYIFPNGKNGYLPAYGEIYVANDYATKINEAMSIIGGTNIAVSAQVFYWTSTQWEATYAFACTFKLHFGEYKGKYMKYNVRPFTSLSV